MPQDYSDQQLLEMATGQSGRANVDSLYKGRNIPKTTKPKEKKSTELTDEDKSSLVDSLISALSPSGNMGVNSILAMTPSPAQPYFMSQYLGNLTSEGGAWDEITKWLEEQGEGRIETRNEGIEGMGLDPEHWLVQLATAVPNRIDSMPGRHRDNMRTAGSWTGAVGRGVTGMLDPRTERPETEADTEAETPEVPEGDGPPEGAPVSSSVVGGSNDDMPVWDWGTPAQDMDTDNITTDDDIIELAQAIEAYGHAPSVWSGELGFGINNSGHLEELIRTRRSPREGPNAPIGFEQFREMARQQLIKQWNEISQGAPVPSQAERLARNQIQRQLEAQQRQAAQDQLSAIETPEGIRRLSSEEQEMYAQGIMQQAQQTSQPEDVQMLQEAWESLGTEEFLIRFFVPGEMEEEEGDE